MPRDDMTQRTRTAVERAVHETDVRLAAAAKRAQQWSAVWAVLAICGSLVGAGWAAAHWSSTKADADEVRAMKIVLAEDRTEMAAIRQAHEDDKIWKTRVESKMDHLIDWVVRRGAPPRDGDRDRAHR